MMASAVHGGFAIHGGELVSGSPFVYEAPADEVARPGWSGALALLAEPVDLAPGDVDIVREVLDGARRTLAGIAADAALAALVEVYRVANARLMTENRRRGTRRRLYLGLTSVVLCRGDLFAAHVPPGQLLLRQGGSLFAYPPLASWCPEFQAERTYELPNPLGLRPDLEPRCYYSRAEHRDLVLAVSSHVARQLTRLEPELRAARGADDALALIREWCGRAGTTVGHGSVVRVPALGRSGLLQAARSPVPGQRPVVARQKADGDPAAPVSRLLRNWLARPLDPDAASVQTEVARRWAFDRLGKHEPGHPGSGYAVRADLTDDLPALPLHPTRA